MKIDKTIYTGTLENEYRVELEINVIVTPPEYWNDVSDIDFYGCTELVDYRINSVQIRTCIQNPVVPRQKKDAISYTYEDVQMEDLSPEEREELINEINREVDNECNC